MVAWANCSCYSLTRLLSCSILNFNVLSDICPCILRKASWLEYALISENKVTFLCNDSINNLVQFYGLILKFLSPHRLYLGRIVYFYFFHWDTCLLHYLSHCHRGNPSIIELSMKKAAADCYAIRCPFLQSFVVNDELELFILDIGGCDSSLVVILWKIFWQLFIFCVKVVLLSRHDSMVWLIKQWAYRSPR